MQGLSMSHQLKGADEIRALLSSALKANPDNVQTVEDVEAALMRGEALFWNYGQTVAVTKTRGVSLHIWLLAGKLEGVPALIERSSEYAKLKGLHGVVIENWRRGWKRYLHPHGFHEMGGWLVKEI